MFTYLVVYFNYFLIRILLNHLYSGILQFRTIAALQEQIGVSLKGDGLIL